MCPQNTQILGKNMISPAETKNLKFWIFVYIFDFLSQVCLFIVIP